jgi:uncharacterized protein (DUF169 family)
MTFRIFVLFLRIEKLIKQRHIQTTIGGKMKDWKEISNTLKKYLNLPTYPVGIKLFEDRKDLFGHELKRKMNLCQLVAIARYHHRVSSIVRENHVCSIGSSCLGFIKTPERIKDGIVSVGAYVKDKKAGKNFQASVQKIGDKGKKYDAITVSPLDLSVEPQVVVMYLSPARAARMVHASLYRNGNAIEAKICAEAALCSAIAKVILFNKPIIDLPCAGDRSYGGVQERELIFAFPPNQSEEIIQGLKETHNYGISAHPFKPFVYFTPTMRAGYETTGEDLKR